MVCPSSGSLSVAVSVFVVILSTGAADPEVVVVEVDVGVGLADASTEPDVDAVAPAGAVGSAVTGDSPLQAASATTGATRPTTASRRRRAPEAVEGRARAAAGVFMSLTA